MDRFTEEQICKKYPFTKQQDHVRKKDMWAGTSKVIESQEYIMNEDGTVEDVTISYPPALYKCFDEALVNAIDYLVRTGLVTKINVDFDPKSGRITILNDGPGIEIVMHPIAKKYVPEFIFGTLLQGSNIDKGKDSITGGTNGVGIKIANILSTEFTIKTASGGKLYTQTWTDGMNNCGAPEIIKYNGPEFTEVSFLPDYNNHFNYNISLAGPTLDKLFRFRTYMGAIYASFAGNHTTVVKTSKLTGPCNINITYRGKEITQRTMEEVAKMILPDLAHIPCKVGPTPYSWDVVVSIGEVRLSKTTDAVNSVAVSNVNGVLVNQGKHIKHLYDQLINSTKEKIEGVLLSSNIKFKTSIVKNIVSLFINAKIPDVSWSSQTKDNVNLDKSALESYVFDKKTIENITDIIYNLILTTVFAENIEKGPSSRRKKINIDKYTPARFACKGEDPGHCYLFLPEGDSAMSMCENGIGYYINRSANKGGPKKRGKKEELPEKVAETGPNQHMPDLSFDYYGILTLRGVIVNVRKASEILSINKKQIIKLSTKLRENAFFNAFIEATGLNINYKYEKGSPTYEKEKSELRYGGGIIGCVDQDHAGVGFIFSLIINMFARFWPALLKEGYVKRFITPVRRARPKKGGQIIEFYNEYQYKRWIKEDPARESAYEIVYIKGLATNTKLDVQHMFEMFRNNVVTYNYDNLTDKTYEDYFGRDTDIRKEILKVPYEPPTEEIEARELTLKQIDCSDHARFEAKPHKLTNLEQKLYKAYDGMNECGRKILYGAIKKFSHSNKEIKVAQLGSYVAEVTRYHYGEQSLFKSIIGKGFLAVGGVQLPQLIPCSDGFGTRNGDDAGQPRYLNIKLNKKLVDLLYPSVDNELLPEKYDDGDRIEPEYFVPIIPMAIIESIEIPADGWKIKVWGRDVFAVINGVRELIKSPEARPNMPPNLRGFKGETCIINNVRWSVGKYRYDEKTCTIHVDELPLRVWTEAYIRRIKKKTIEEPTLRKEQPLVREVNKYPRIDSLGIEIKLTDKRAYHEIMNAYAKVTTNYTDGIIEYFELKEAMDSHLNMIDKEGVVREFESYIQVMQYWFTERQDIYRRRIELQKIILNIKIEYYQNVIRYIRESGDLFIIKGKTEPEAIAILEKYNYARINKTKLFNLTDFGVKGLEARLISRPSEKSGQETPESQGDEETTATYNYLLSINDLARLSKNIAKLNEDMEKCKIELDELTKKAEIGRFPGAQIWLDELDKLEHIVKEGLRTNWLYGDSGKFNYGPA